MCAPGPRAIELTETFYVSELFAQAFLRDVGGKEIVDAAFNRR